MENFTNVTIRDTHELKKVNITSDSKPDINDLTIAKWQTLIDTLAKIVDVPSGLIMRLNKDSIEVFLKSNTDNNPYVLHEKTPLKYGLYCETVIGTQKQLIVSDALKSSIWRINNPDIDLNMISYLGVPINWPDGECFGTVCVLDHKENNFSNDFIDLIHQIKQHIEVDLQLILHNKELEEINEVKTKFLSLISHDIRGNLGTIHQFLQLITSNFDQFNSSELKKTLISLSQISSSSFTTLDNLLKWSKIDLVKLKAHIEPVNINEIIKELLSFFNLALKLKSVHINTSFDSDEMMINTDKNMLTAILRNLISNSIKYNKVEGKINIKVTRQNNKHIISIKDTGIGIPEPDLQNLFKYSIKQSLNSKEHISTQIGLILTKEFIDKIGATINVDSTINVGTTVKITI
ncbi:GAF domain-containing sensor histidine kinase [Plebeiibacterium sediminum]|uniref:histidine kinase n=1 Tax=Plebeiibacterium sediminum TaxID=2992112 RepID=A0AAE3M739_9BACT|nr:ATP-binding protein [Plebeiobacterium sediminum]MCW3788127.1 ATP-binding protein [Plebeiobacterium sediminum]